MVITEKQYEALMNRFQTMKTPIYFPTAAHIQEMEKDPEKYVLFACYLYEKLPQASTSTEKAQKQNLQRFIYQHLEFCD